MLIWKQLMFSFVWRLILRSLRTSKMVVTLTILIWTALKNSWAKCQYAIIMHYCNITIVQFGCRCQWVFKLVHSSVYTKELFKERSWQQVCVSEKVSLSASINALSNFLTNMKFLSVNLVIIQIALKNSL